MCVRKVRILTLLIVPYGIETQSHIRSCHLPSLLIVPYGIETFLWGANDASKGTFNRTLWN